MSNGMHHKDYRLYHHHSGFTLLEVLITVIILSIGILGLAGLQFNALRSNQNAAQATIAVLQLIDAADRLRGNIVGAKAGNYDHLTGSSNDPKCIQTGCNDPALLAQYDDWSWNQQLTTLPDGQGVICFDSTPNDGDGADNSGCEEAPANEDRLLFAAKVWWDDDLNPETPRRRQTMSITP